MDVFGFILMMLAFFFFMRKKQPKKSKPALKRKTPPRQPSSNQSITLSDIDNYITSSSSVNKSPTITTIQPPSSQHFPIAYNVFSSPTSISRGKRLIQKLPSKKELIIMREIMSPPKSAGAIRSHEFWD